MGKESVSFLVSSGNSEGLEDCREGEGEGDKEEGEENSHVNLEILTVGNAMEYDEVFDTKW